MESEASKALYPPRFPRPSGYEPDFSYLSLEPIPTMPVNKMHVINLVSTFNLGRRLTVSQISRKHPHYMYFSSALVAGMHRLRQPKLTCLIFNSGLVLVNGAKYPIQAILAAWQCCRMLRRCGATNVSVNDFRLENITYTVFICDAFDILSYKKRYPTTCQYTPENFPALTQRSKVSSLTMNFFDTGRIVVTGAKEVSEGTETFATRLPVLQNYILTDKVKIEALRAEIKRLTNEGKSKKRAAAEAEQAEIQRCIDLGLPLPSKRRKTAAAKAAAKRAGVKSR